jgi:hypothetical protein
MKASENGGKAPRILKSDHNEFGYWKKEAMLGIICLVAKIKQRTFCN